MDEFEKITGGMEGDPIGIRTDDEPDLGAAEMAAQEKRLVDSRFDPTILFSEIKAADWRVAATTNAEGINHPAVVDGGTILFFEPVPGGGHSNFAGDQGGGKAPYPTQLVRMGIEMLCPPTRTSFLVVPLTGDPYNVFFPSQSAMLAAVIMRGLFSLELGDVPVYKQIPVSDIGAAGGIFFSGDQFGAAQNMQPSWTNGFKMPDDLILDPQSNTALKAWIKLNPADLVKLGNGATPTDGWGNPLPMTPRIHDPGTGVETLVPTLTPYFGVRLHWWGKRGLNIRAGRSSLVKAVAKRR